MKNISRYKESLDRVITNYCVGYWEHNVPCDCPFNEDVKIIQEGISILDELTKTPTEEEIKKEWEELGYEWINEEEHIYLYNDNKSKEIVICKKDKRYYCHEEGPYTDYKIFEILTFQEHQLLTKTFKWLGWFDEN